MAFKLTKKTNKASKTNKSSKTTKGKTNKASKTSKATGPTTSQGNGVLVFAPLGVVFAESKAGRKVVEASIGGKWNANPDEYRDRQEWRFALIPLMRSLRVSGPLGRIKVAAWYQTTRSDGSVRIVEFSGNADWIWSHYSPEDGDDRAIVRQAREWGRKRGIDVSPLNEA